MPIITLCHGITVKVSKIQGNSKAISIDPQTKTTDANGEATFTIYGNKVTEQKSYIEY